MGLENNSLKPAQGRNLPPAQSDRGNWELSAAAPIECVYLLPDNTYGDWVFTPLYTIHLLLFTQDFPVRLTGVQRNVATGFTTWPVAFIADGDQGAIFPGANGIYTPDYAQIGPRQQATGRTLTNRVQVNGFYFNGFIFPYDAGEEYFLFLDVTTAAGVPSGEVCPTYNVFTGGTFEQELPVLLREDQYTQTMRDAGNVHLGLQPFAGNVRHKIIGLWQETNP